MPAGASPFKRVEPPGACECARRARRAPARARLAAAAAGRLRVVTRRRRRLLLLAQHCERVPVALVQHLVMRRGLEALLKRARLGGRVGGGRVQINLSSESQ